MQASKRPRKGLGLEDALEEISRLPEAQRRQLCKAAALYLSSPAAVEIMHMLGELPENHPRKLINKQRTAYALMQLLIFNILPKEVLELELAAEDWYKMEPV